MIRRTSTTGLELAAIHAAVAAAFPAVTIETADGASWLRAPAEGVLDLARFLRDAPTLRFDSLMCLSGIDLSAVAPEDQRQHISCIGIVLDHEQAKAGQRLLHLVRLRIGGR